MANLSKQKRETMLSFLETLKQQHTDDSSIRAFNEIENQLNDKKFGLVFEEHTEEVDEMLKENIPVLNADETRKICKNTAVPYNFIIEGDNLQALYLLEKTHRGRVDCIYIDPPYNTGAKDWKYNNDYVDKNDTYRHSKWLSMMRARMVQAKMLLKPDGTFVCAIDENELGTTLLLIQDVFGINFAVDCITIIHNPRGVQGDNFSYTHEYAIFVYRKGMKVIATKEVSEEDIDWSPLRNWGTESERHDAANCFYPILIKNEEIVGFGEDVTNDDSIHPKRNEYDAESDTYSVYPIDDKGIERKWRYARQTVESIKDLLRVVYKKGTIDIELGKDYAPYKTVWTDKKYDANEYGSQLIGSMVPQNDFDFPKSLYNVYECIYALTKNKPHAIILDYFAGSGTTGHATLLMNQLDGGKRHFILCTNNEIGEKREKEYKKVYGEIDTNSETWNEWTEKFGIARSVTYPRITSAINGFVHTKDYKIMLFKKRLSFTVLKNSSSVLTEIEQIRESEKEKFSTFKLEIEENEIRLYGVKKKGEHIDGFNANVKYFKCDWTSRKPEEYLLSNALCLHIKEMIELQNAIEIDNIKNVLILNKDDFKNTILNKNVHDKIEKIWVNQNMIFNSEELELLNNKGYKYIPKEFFGQELREVAE